MKSILFHYNNNNRCAKRCHLKNSLDAKLYDKTALRTNNVPTVFWQDVPRIMVVITI